MIGLPVYKMTGSGNDFVMVDGRITSPEQWTPEDIRSICARGMGIGADGIVIVAPGSTPDSARMIYFNSDGSRAAMCGNAALCSMRLAALLGLVPERMRLETDAGVYDGSAIGGADTAELHLATVPAPSAPRIALAAGESRIGFAVVGVPHLVVQVEDLAAVDLAQRGRALRYDPALGTAGANVNFVAPVDGRGAWAMRTYERGVEAETLACGTGAVAAACVLREWRLAKPPTTIVTRSGLPLVVRAERGSEGAYTDVWLEGQARLVFRGVLMG